MREVARWSREDRRDLFRETAVEMGAHPAIVEKDFWVCLVLDYLFADSPWKERLSFKGGTSLSKAFAAIERFSEDIDLVLDWRILGYTDTEPLAARSATQQARFGKLANQRAADFLMHTVAPTLGAELSERVAEPMRVYAEGENVRIRYPRAFALDAIQPEIQLEIGPIAAWLPHSQRPIRPYAAEHFPNAFKQQYTSVRTIDAERTFWEKATILHQEAHRTAEKRLPPRYSRHYYDLYRMTLLPLCDAALERTDLLRDVVEFKKHFYRAPWANYDSARPGSLRLLPQPHHRKALLEDYLKMRAMLFGAIPSFEMIEQGLTALENRINRH
ncbi:MAG: nucleotidyl transferase AbiEii/AbiGii toxin family protein [Candidatus Hydrogenedentes bacterium]|nr:nucleotidyl transferase AbiEii/AbiGii toxin family protein [Candidatus Hydrogenedentota bacterium]